MAFDSWSALLNAMAIGALATFAVVVISARPAAGPFRLIVLLTLASAICWLASRPYLRDLATFGRPELYWLLGFAGAPLVGLFWVAIRVLFDDVRLTPARFIPAVLLMTPGITLVFDVGPAVFAALIGFWHLLNGLLAIHAFVVIARGWRNDLVEARRRLRKPVLFALSAAALIVIGFTVLFLARQAGFTELRVYPMIDACIAVMAIAGGAMMMDARGDLFPPARPRQFPDDSAEDNTIAVLDRLMVQGVWRREGLTIADLALEVGAPGYRLRRLINGRLGYRNFTAFLNAARIEAARKRLSDPAEAAVPISKIAYELGFGSLGPFNRAFKEAAGQTPTEFRKAALGGDRDEP